jgi:acyl-CoA synthetase (AMP-forming)/AMP-acid ligase II
MDANPSLRALTRPSTDGDPVGRQRPQRRSQGASRALHTRPQLPGGALRAEGGPRRLRCPQVSYDELHREVCRLANALRRLGVKKGQCVCICMPMVPEAAFAMLACARIGAVHSGRRARSPTSSVSAAHCAVVFAGFSAEALRDRIVEGRCEFVITADEARRLPRAHPGPHPQACARRAFAATRRCR